MEIKPIDLTLSEDLKAYLALIKYFQGELNKWVSENIGITQEQNGSPGIQRPR